MDSAIVAKQIKAELKKQFPETKFSVRSSKYSLGQSIRVEWQDGPSTTEVENITSRFEQVRRDETGEILSGGNLFVQTTRKISTELRAWAEAFYQECHAGNEPEWRKQEIIRGIANFDPQFTSRYVYFNDLSPQAEELLEATVEAESEPVETTVEVVDDEVDYECVMYLKLATLVLESVEAETVEAVEVMDMDEVKSEMSLTPVDYRVTAKFADLNKNDNISDYIEQIKSGEFTTEFIDVGYELTLSIPQWNALINSLLDSRFPRGLNKAILVKCGWQKIIIHTSGFTYARYVGLDVQDIPVHNVIQFPNAG